MNAASAGRPCERRDPYAVPERQAIAVTAPAVILSFLFRGMIRHSTPRLPVSCAAGMLLNIPGCKALNGKFVGIVIFAVVIASDALSQQSLQELEDMSRFKQALAAVDAIQHRKTLQCVIAIANRALCDCLSRKLPVNIYFRSYASITNQEKEAPEYGQLSAADKKIVDLCVSDSR